MGLGIWRPCFGRSDQLDALDFIVALFGRFWTANRRAHRRLRAAALHDAELAAALEKASAWAF